MTFQVMQAILSMTEQENSPVYFPMGKKANRIKYIREQVAGLTQTEFAAALSTVDGTKVSRGAVGNWELGKGITSDNLSAIAARFGVSLDWLEFGKGDLPKATLRHQIVKKHETGSYTDIGQPVANVATYRSISGFSKIPVRGQGVMGATDGALIFLTDRNQGDVLAPPSLTDIPDAYAVYVVGNTMLERFRHGEVVFVHPYVPVREGDDCVVQLKGRDGEPALGYIKRFLSLDEKSLTLLQLNPRKTLVIPASQVISAHRIVMAGPA